MTETVLLDTRPGSPEVSVVIVVRDEWPYLAKCLRALFVANEPHETIVVDNASAARSGERAATLMRALGLAGCVLRLSENTGFAAGNNRGARYARGKYVCLLNPDTVPPAGWLSPMIDFLKSHPDTWLVGNLQVSANGFIHSIGSEYDYGTRCFEHVRRGGPVDLSIREIAEPTERDMVTGSCIVMPRGKWDLLAGFDECYRMLYWEDTDLCMRAREAGGRIWYVPTPPMLHHQGASGGAPGGRAHRDANARRFHARWVETGQVDRFKMARGLRAHAGRIRAGSIVLNEEEYLAASVESVIAFVDEVVLVLGGTRYALAAGMCTERGEPTDGTLGIARELAMRHPGKIRLVGPRLWRDKAEQRGAYCASLREGDWLLVVDGDEVWHESGLWRLSYLMHTHEVVTPGYWSLWNDLFTVGTGVWDEYHTPRAIRWRRGYRYLDHVGVSDAGGRPLAERARGHARVGGERLFCHYGWVKPVEKLRRKLEYYRHQPAEVRRADYIDAVFLAWRADRAAVVRDGGTHPMRKGHGGAAPFRGVHPPGVVRLLRDGKAGGSRW